MLYSLSGKIGSGKDTVFNILQFLDYKKNHDGLCTFDEWMEGDLSLRNELSSIKNKKFAYKLKLMVADLTGCRVEQLEQEHFKNLKTKISNNLGHYYSHRELMQIIGEGLRREIGEKIWVDSLLNDYEENSKWVITDLRYKNEFGAIKERGGVNIRIERKKSFEDWANYLNVPVDRGNKIEKIFKSEFMEVLYNEDFPNKKEFLRIHSHSSEIDLDNYYSKFDYVIVNDSTIEDLIDKIEKLNIV